MTSKPHSESFALVRGAIEPRVGETLYASHPKVVALAHLDRIEEQFEALRLAATRQLTPLDVAATHIDILRRKSEDYTPQERDNVAAIVESHVKEARTALFAAISNPASKPYCTCPEGADGNPCAVCGKPESVTYPATESAVASGADKSGPSGEPGADSVPASNPRAGDLLWMTVPDGEQPPAGWTRNRPSDNHAWRIADGTEPDPAKRPS